MSKRHNDAPSIGALGSGTKNIIGAWQKAVLFRMRVDAYLKRLSRSFPRFDNWSLIRTNYQHRYEAPIEHDDDANYDHEHTGDYEDSSLHSEIRRTTAELTGRRDSINLRRIFDVTKHAPAAPVQRIVGPQPLESFADE